MTQNIEPLLTTSKVAGIPTNSLLDNKMYKFNIKRNLYGKQILYLVHNLMKNNKYYYENM